MNINDKNHIPGLKEGQDYTWNELGQMILTKSYLEKRGHCCKNGCSECPYGFVNTSNPDIPSELNDHWAEEVQTSSEGYTVDPEEDS